MKKYPCISLPVALLLASFAADIGHAQTIDSFVMTRQHYDVTITEAVGTTFVPGRGIDMRDPLNPRLSLRTGFGNDVEVIGTTKPIGRMRDDELTQSSFSLVETSSQLTEARTLYVSLNARFKFLSLQAALEHVQKERSESLTRYFQMEAITTGQSVDGNKLTWIEAPTSESAAPTDASGAINDFVSKYGTHFIQSVNYGYRLTVRGSVRTADSAERIAFEGAFKAWGQGLELSGSQEKQLAESNVEIVGQLTSGPLVDQNGNAIEFVMTGFGNIQQFVEAVKQREIQIYRAPVTARAVSYYATLDQYPMTKSLFAEKSGATPISPFGVPRGTVVPWVPLSEHQSNINGKIEIRVPEGWAICDGRDGTPDLNDRFVKAVTSLDMIAKVGGRENHQHTISIGDTADGQDDAREGGDSYHAAHNTHKHPGNSSPEVHLPPFYTLIFIMKL